MYFNFIFWFFMLHSPCFSKNSLNTKQFSLPAEELGSQINFSTNDYSWARGNTSCHQLLRQIVKYLQVLPSCSEQFVRPAVGLGLMQIGCLSETDPFFSEIIKDENATRMFRLLSDQWKTFVKTNITYHPTWKNAIDVEYLRFNLQSLAPASLSGNLQHCSGFWKEKKDLLLTGLNLRQFHSLQEAKLYCDILGQSCSGVTFSFGRYYTVAKSGGPIVTKLGACLWLHRCTSGHVRRRSVTFACNNKREEDIHRIMQWVPLVSGWYSAGTAIYYARMGCSEQAEERAIDAAVSLGYDALISVTGGATNVLSLGIAIKPALKAGAHSAIEYIKQYPPKNENIA